MSRHCSKVGLLEYLDSALENATDSAPNLIFRACKSLLAGNSHVSEYVVHFVIMILGIYPIVLERINCSPFQHDRVDCWSIRKRTNEELDRLISKAIPFPPSCFGSPPSAAAILPLNEKDAISKRKNFRTYLKVQ
jgi:hypothetical protein